MRTAAAERWAFALQKKMCATPGCCRVLVVVRAARRRLWMLVLRKISSVVHSTPGVVTFVLHLQRHDGGMTREKLARVVASSRPSESWLCRIQIPHGYHYEQSC